METVLEAIGPKLRRQRRRLGLTLDELAGRTGISKPYLSLIETGRVPNPPSDEKLRKLEHSLGFPPNELVTQAHLFRTPQDVRAMLARLLTAQKKEPGDGNPDPSTEGSPRRSESTALAVASAAPANLDEAYLSGVLHELADRRGANVERIQTNAVPVINRVSAGYPSDFTDLAYPRGVADDYIGCPDVHDRDAFACRVSGDSMTPKYREGDIVIFSPAAPPKNGDDCFVRFSDSQTTFKRVFFETSDTGQSILRLQPRNEKYRPRTLPAEEISGLYKAIFRYQRVDED